MRTLAAAIWALSLWALSFTASAGADEFKSGTPVGGAAGPSFHVIGITGPKAGKTYCQVCDYGPRPVAIVFARKFDALAGLVKPLEAKVAELEDKGLRAFVSRLGDADVDDIRKLAGDTKTKLPLTISVNRDGPPDYKLNNEAAVTVVVYNAKRKVVANFAFKDAKDLTADKAAEIAKSLDKAVE